MARGYWKYYLEGERKVKKKDEAKGLKLIVWNVEEDHFPLTGPTIPLSPCEGKYRQEYPSYSLYYRHKNSKTESRYDADG